MDLKKIKYFASASGLEDAIQLWQTPDAETLCNGIGAGYFPEKLRRFLDERNPAVQAPAAIHDLDYSAGGDASDRRKADWKFLKNCFRAANFLYGVADIRRYLARIKAIKFYILLRFCGGAAFNYRRGSSRS